MTAKPLSQSVGELNTALDKLANILTDLKASLASAVTPTPRLPNRDPELKVGSQVRVRLDLNHGGQRGTVRYTDGSGVMVVFDIDQSIGHFLVNELEVICLPAVKACRPTQTLTSDDAERDPWDHCHGA